MKKETWSRIKTNIRNSFKFVIGRMQVYSIPILIGFFVGVLIVGAQVAGTIQYDSTNKVFKIHSTDSLNVGGSLTVGKGLTVSSDGLNVSGGLTVATGNIALSAANATVDNVNLDNVVTNLSAGTGIEVRVPNGSWGTSTTTGNTREIRVAGSVPTGCGHLGTGISSCSISSNTLSVSVDDARYVNTTGDTMTGSLTLSGSTADLSLTGMGAGGDKLDVTGIIRKKVGTNWNAICKRYSIEVLPDQTGNNTVTETYNCPTNYFAAAITDLSGNAMNPRTPLSAGGYLICCWAEW